MERLPSGARQLRYCHSGGVQVVGVDLASADSNTALAVLTKKPQAWQLTSLRCPASDEDILADVKRLPPGSRAGFDCPLGWPMAFAEFIADHMSKARHRVPAKAELMKRCTDTRVAELVAEQTHPPVRLTPLSVSSDRIAIPAWRMAQLERQLFADDAPDRSGRGLIAEVYPAAALAMWQLPHRGYKGRDGRQIRQDILAGISQQVGDLLVLGDFEEQLQASDHCLDALLSALVTVSVVTGRLAPDSLPQEPAEEQRARAEGWIQLPAHDLAAILA